MNCETPLTSHRKSLRIRRCLVLLLLAVNTPPAFVFAQDTPAPPNPPIHFQVLGTTTINLGNRSAIYNLVAPPLLPPTPTPEPPTTPPLTAEQMQALEAQLPPPKKNVALFLSASVYDHQITRLSWSDENGRHVAFSNLDFNYFTGPGFFETADTSYFLLMGIGNETREGAAANNVQLPALSQFSPTQSQYIVVQDGSNPPTAESLKWIDDTHTYFDANKQRMIDSYNKLVADNLARAQWLKDHPPVPQNTVINFWPVQSTNYPTTPEGGQQ